MANSTTTLDLLSASQANKEVSANSLFDAMSPAALYGRRASTSAALTFGYYGGTVMISGTPTQIADGTVTLAASTTNYVEANPATGAVSVNQTGFTSGRTPLYQVDTGAATVSSYTDLRVLGGGGATSADIASAIAAHDAAADPHPQYLTQSEGDARYASSTAATGVSSVNGHTGAVTLAASDVGAVPSTSLGAVSGVAQLGSDQKLLASQLPDLGIVDFLGTVASQAAMLALTGQKGDWCIRSDDGKAYTITGSNPTLAASWTAMSYPVGNGGTVTSVDLSVPGLLYTASGNPVTTSGTLTISLKTQAANTVLAGPTSGTAAAPTMRALVAADMAALLAAVNVFTKNQSVAPVALTDGATISVDASLSNNFSVTLGGNRTLANPTNLTAGMVLNFAIDQDATGSRTLAFGSLYKFAGVNTLSTAASAKDLISCYYDGTILRCSLNKGFA